MIPAIHPLPHMKSAALLFFLLLQACAPVGSRASGRIPKSSSSDRIMVVSRNPPSFAFHRLSLLSAAYPDLAAFTSQNGSPDFFAETNRGENRYLILYFLKPGRTFAARSGSESNAMEFSGPYPITANEKKTLLRLRD